MSWVDEDIIILPPSRGKKKRKYVDRVITFKAEGWLIEKLDKLAKKHKCSRSELIRKILVEYVEKEKESLKPQPIEDDMPPIH